MGRTYHQADLIRRVIQSLYHMVAESYQVFVVGHILPDDTVKGGTGWAVELARLFNRPIWVFDQDRASWFHWHDSRWEPATPTIGERTFCGTGTRNLTEDGKRAIAELFTRSFGAPVA
jgi:hypothetical protein